MTIERGFPSLDRSRHWEIFTIQRAGEQTANCALRSDCRLPGSPSRSTCGTTALVVDTAKIAEPGYLKAIRGCTPSPRPTLPSIRSNPAKHRKMNPPNANLRSTPLCPTNSSRSDSTVKSPRSTNRRQEKEPDLMRSGPFEAVRRTLRFSRLKPRRKVFSEDEKRNADQCAPTGREPNRHR